jgi:mono/diheme cytochrome c family protein
MAIEVVTAMKTAGGAAARALVLAAAVLVAHGLASGQDRAPAATERRSDEALTGAKLFAAGCGWCHQGGGRAVGRGPKLAGIDKSDEYLIGRIKTGKEGAMPSYQGAFTEAQLRAIVIYIRSLKDDK